MSKRLEEFHETARQNIERVKKIGYGPSYRTIPYDPSRCAEGLYARFTSHQCRNKVWKDGCCKIHHPESRLARDEKSEKRWKERQNSSPLNQLWTALERIKELEAEITTLKSKEAK